MKKLLTILWVLAIVATIHITNRFTHIEENLLAIADSTLDYITKEEGFRNRAYRDSKGLLTIGVGHLIKPDEQHLVSATLTDEQVKELLKSDLKWCSAAVESSVRVPLNQSQFDALYSICFNLGTTNFKKSTFLKQINAGKLKEASDSFLMWNKPPELLPRRNRERALFLKDI